MLVKLDSVKVKGLSLTKSVRIHSNDTANQDYPLHMTGDILPVLDADPAVPRLAGLAGTPLEGSVTLKKGSWLDIEEILGLEVKRNQITLGEVEVVQPGQEFRIPIRAAASETGGRLRDEVVVRVRTSDGEERQTQFGVQVEHNPEVVFDPAGNMKFLSNHIQSLRNPGSPPVTRRVVVRPGDPSISVNVLEAKLDESLRDAFRVEVVPMAGGQGTSVNVHLDAWQETTNLMGKLTIRTDHPKFPEYSIYVLAHFGNSGPVVLRGDEERARDDEEHDGHEDHELRQD